MQQQAIKIKNIKIKGKKVSIRAIGPVDFIGVSEWIEGVEGVPFGLFKLKEGPVGMAGQAMKNAESAPPDFKALQEIMIAILRVGLLAINGKAAKAADIVANDPELAVHIYSAILERSLTAFNGEVEMSKDQALYWDCLATRYGKTPIEVLCPNGGYTDLDASLFNTFIASVGMKQEVSIQKQQMQRMRTKR